MDVNLTHAIAANVTLMQPSKGVPDTWIAFSSAVIVVLISVAANYLITKKNIEATRENNNKMIAASLENAIKMIEQEKSKMHEEELQEKRNKRQEAYSLLLGHKYKILQFHVSYYAICINSLSLFYHVSLVAFNNINLESDELSRTIECRRRGSLTQEELEEANRYIQKNFAFEFNRSPDLKESFRTRQRSEELQLELARNIEEFFEIIGRVKILFPSQEVRILIKHVEKSLENLGEIDKEINQKYEALNKELSEAMASTTSIKADSINSNKKLHDWVAGKESELRARVEELFKKMKARIDNDLDPRIIDLLEHLEDEIKKEQ